MGQEQPLTGIWSDGYYTLEFVEPNYLVLWEQSAHVDESEARARLGVYSTDGKELTVDWVSRGSQVYPDPAMTFQVTTSPDALKLDSSIGGFHLKRVQPVSQSPIAGFWLSEVSNDRGVELFSGYVIGASGIILNISGQGPDRLLHAGGGAVYRLEDDRIYLRVPNGDNERWKIVEHKGNKLKFYFPDKIPGDYPFKLRYTGPGVMDQKENLLHIPELGRAEEPVPTWPPFLGVFTIFWFFHLFGVSVSPGFGARICCLGVGGRGAGDSSIGAESGDTLCSGLASLQEAPPRWFRSLWPRVGGLGCCSVLEHTRRGRVSSLDRLDPDRAHRASRPRLFFESVSSPLDIPFSNLACREPCVRVPNSRFATNSDSPTMVLGVGSGWISRLCCSTLVWEAGPLHFGGRGD